MTKENDAVTSWSLRWLPGNLTVTTRLQDEQIVFGQSQARRFSCFQSLC